MKRIITFALRTENNGIWRLSLRKSICANCMR